MGGSVDYDKGASRNIFRSSRKLSNYGIGGIKSNIAGAGSINNLLEDFWRNAVEDVVRSDQVIQAQHQTLAEDNKSTGEHSPLILNIDSELAITPVSEIDDPVNYNIDRYVVSKEKISPSNWILQIEILLELKKHVSTWGTEGLIVQTRPAYNNQNFAQVNYNKLLNQCPAIANKKGNAQALKWIEQKIDALDLKCRQYNNRITKNDKKYALYKLLNELDNASKEEKVAMQFLLHYYRQPSAKDKQTFLLNMDSENSYRIMLRTIAPLAYPFFNKNINESDVSAPVVKEAMRNISNQTKDNLFILATHRGLLNGNAFGYYTKYSREFEKVACLKQDLHTTQEKYRRVVGSGEVSFIESTFKPINHGGNDLHSQEKSGRSLCDEGNSKNTIVDTESEEIPKSISELLEMIPYKEINNSKTVSIPFSHKPISELRLFPIKYMNEFTVWFADGSYLTAVKDDRNSLLMPKKYNKAINQARGVDRLLLQILKYWPLMLLPAFILQGYDVTPHNSDYVVYTGEYNLFVDLSIRSRKAVVFVYQLYAKHKLDKSIQVLIPRQLIIELGVNYVCGNNTNVIENIGAHTIADFFDFTNLNVSLKPLNIA